MLEPFEDDEELFEEINASPVVNITANPFLDHNSDESSSSEDSKSDHKEGISPKKVVVSSYKKPTCKNPFAMTPPSLTIRYMKMQEMRNKLLL